MSWRRHFGVPPVEHGFLPLELEGRLPESLSGVWYRNGPGALPTGAGHWFDADGVITAVRFHGGAAHGAVRAVATRDALLERRAGRRLFAGFGQSLPGALRQRNPGNTSMLWWSGGLYALAEAGRPHAITPDELATRGEVTLGGLELTAFTAHPHRVPALQTTFGFNVRYGRAPLLELFALSDAGEARRLGLIPLPWNVPVHDFAVTSRHAVFLLPPADVDLDALAGGAAFTAATRWRPEQGMVALIVPLADPGSALRVELPAAFLWHLANAYEYGAELLIDWVRHPDLSVASFYGNLGLDAAAEVPATGELVRTRISLDDRSARSERLCAAPLEFPVIAPAEVGEPHRRVLATELRHGFAPPVGLIAIDARSGGIQRVRLDAGHYVSEPAVVDDWLLCLVLDARAGRTHLAVFRLDALDAGPVARAFFPDAAPLGLHGTWVSAAQSALEPDEKVRMVRAPTEGQCSKS